MEIRETGSAQATCSRRAGDPGSPHCAPRAGGLGYSCAAAAGDGKILPYLFTRNIQIRPLTVIAKGAMSRAQSEKPCKTIAVTARPRRTNPPPSIALAKTIGLRVIRKEYLEFPRVDQQRLLTRRSYGTIDE
jgi:hypothetical protein